MERSGGVNVFVANHSHEYQLSFLDKDNYLTEREKRFLNKSWAKYFAESIFPKIDEKPYAVLYSEQSSRPNTPVNVILGALLIKELAGLSDEDMVTGLMFDIRYQYALHTTSFTEQPLSDRTLGRFRARCTAYETKTGTDLIKNTVTQLSKELAKMMKIDTSLKRMDSMMVASNIKKMGRLELLYTCVANLAKELKKAGQKLPENLEHYIDKDDVNQVIYHNRSEDTSSKIQTVLADAKQMEEICGSDFDESSAYQLLLRVLKEQTIESEEGELRQKTKEDGKMNSSILQNPADPEATYREKGGKQNRGYVANLTESRSAEGSIITDYQYEQNTYSDQQFMKDAIEEMGEQENKITVVTDGAYGGAENIVADREKNIELITTNLTGRAAEDILAEFEFNEDGSRVIKCANGIEPKSNSYNQKTGQCVVSL